MYYLLGPIFKMKYTTRSFYDEIFCYDSSNLRARQKLRLVQMKAIRESLLKEGINGVGSGLMWRKDQPIKEKPATEDKPTSKVPIP